MDLDLTQIALPLILTVLDPKSLDLELVVQATASPARASVLNTINSDQMLLNSNCLRVSSTDLTRVVSDPAPQREDSSLLPQASSLLLRDNSDPPQASSLLPRDSSDPQSVSSELPRGNHTVLPRDRLTDLVPSTTAVSSPSPRLTTVFHLEVPPPMADPHTVAETPCLGEHHVSYQT